VGWKAILPNPCYKLAGLVKTKVKSENKTKILNKKEAWEK